MRVFIIILFLTILCIIILKMAYQNFKSLTIIAHIREERLLHRCMLYENIFESFIKPKSFLFMKNEGKNLCEDVKPFQYINYKIDNFIV